MLMFQSRGISANLPKFCTYLSFLCELNSKNKLRFKLTPDVDD